MNRPAHFMVSEGTGDLFDTRAADWDKRPPLRPAFERHFGAIESAADFKATVRAGGFAWPGAYPLALICDDGGLLCFDCGRKEARQILYSIRENCRDGWRVFACDICHAEETDDICDHCGQTIAEGPEEESE